MKKTSIKPEKNPFEKLVAKKQQQKVKKIKKLEETNQLRETYLKGSRASVKMVDEKRLRIKRGRNQFVKVGQGALVGLTPEKPVRLGRH